jgi:hypothetical protein
MSGPVVRVDVSGVRPVWPDVCDCDSTGAGVEAPVVVGGKGVSDVAWRSRCSRVVVRCGVSTAWGRASTLGCRVDGGTVVAFLPGDHVLVEAESTDRAARRGVVEEVVRDDPFPRYRIRWDDGHESIYTPAAGALKLAKPAERSA